MIRQEGDMTVTVDLHEAETHLSELIERARLGEEIVIALAGEPVARLVAEHSRKPRQPGSAKGKFVIHDNFDDPLPDDLLDLFEGRDDKLLGD
jgi:prevent-host-death family protein